MRKFLPILIMALFSAYSGWCQDLDSLLDQQMGPQINYATATFKSSRIIDFHSVEQMKTGQLDFRINHRFGMLNTGPYEFWGLDQSTIKLSLELGLTDWLMVGVGRSSYEKTYDGSYKVKLFRQCTGAKNFPVTISYFSSIHINTLKWDNPNQTNYFSSRLAYTNQILVGRKFSERLSLQLSPTLVHRNLVATTLDQNDLWAMGFGGRIKLTTRFSLNFEYYYIARPINQLTDIKYTNPLSFGVDIDTGGHVFQLFVTNSVGNSENHIIGETTGKWSKGDIHFGFNISRVFSVYQGK